MLKRFLFIAAGALFICQSSVSAMDVVPKRQVGWLAWILGATPVENKERSPITVPGTPGQMHYNAPKNDPKPAPLSSAVSMNDYALPGCGNIEKERCATNDRTALKVSLHCCIPSSATCTCGQ